MLVKYINENSVRLYNGVVEIDSVMYANDSQKAKEAGYLPLINTPKPEDNECVFYVRAFVLTDDAVLEEWKAVNNLEEV